MSQQYVYYQHGVLSKVYLEVATRNMANMSMPSFNSLWQMMWATCSSKHMPLCLGQRTILLAEYADSFPQLSVLLEATIHHCIFGQRIWQPYCSGDMGTLQPIFSSEGEDRWFCSSSPSNLTQKAQSCLLVAAYTLGFNDRYWYFVSARVRDCIADAVTFKENIYI